jgi:hypothetical protein
VKRSPLPRPRLVAFLGPSLPAALARRAAPGALLLPPARQGDVWRALALRPRALALVDGVFGDAPSPWHHELLDALDAGVAVFGGASMGALRAAELGGHGMVGVGAIFEAYRDGRLVGDDEVALVHGPAEAGYLPHSLPLVNVRAAAALGVRGRRLDRRDERALLRAAAALPYSDRTWRGVLRRARLRAAAAAWLEALVARGAPDPKREDALATLRAAHRFAASGARPAPAAAAVRPPRRPSSLVRRRKLHDGVTPAGGALVPSGAVLAVLARARDAAALGDAGLRTLLLAGLARALGIASTGPERAAALRRLGAAGREPALRAAGLDGADVLRLADDLALERRLLDDAARAVPDGPAPVEGLAHAARLAGRWEEVARRLARGGGRRRR